MVHTRFGGNIKAISVLLLFMFLATSCNINEKNKLKIKLLESKIKKNQFKIDALKKENEKKENKIQSLMNELSICKQSKIKYINENSNNYQIIDEFPRRRGEAVTRPEAEKGRRSNATTVTDLALQDRPENEEIKHISFSPPSDIIGECKKSDIVRVFHNLTPYFKKCFKNNNIKKGRIGYSWLINEAGDVVKVNLIKNNIYSKNLSNCLSSIIKKGRYNSPKSGVCTISYVFKL